MAEVINLRQARKAKARADKETAAAANRVRFGQSKPQKKKRTAEAERAARDLDGKRIEAERNDG